MNFHRTHYDYSLFRISQEIDAEDLVNFGIIPEFVGRMPLCVSLTSLDREALITILTKPKNNIISQYIYMMELDDCKLNFTDDAFDAIAEQAIKKRTGLFQHNFSYLLRTTKSL